MDWWHDSNNIRLGKLDFDFFEVLSWIFTDIFQTLIDYSNIISLVMDMNWNKFSTIQHISQYNK